MTEPVTVAIELLGRPRVVVRHQNGDQTELPGPKLARSWLLLAVVLERELDRDDVIAILWDGMHDRTDNLNQVTYWAREALGPARKALVAKGSVGLDRSHLPPEVILTSDIESFYDPAARKNPTLAREAVRLYRGRLLTGLRLDQAGKQWVDSERKRQESQLSNHLRLIFPDIDDAEHEGYVRLCHQGKAAEVAGLVPAEHRREAISQPHNVRRLAKNAPIGVIAPVSAWPTAFYTNIIRGIRSGAEFDDPDRRRRIIVFDVAREDVDEIDAVVANAVEHDISGLIALNATWSDRTRSIMHKRGRRVVSVMVEDLSPPVCCSVLLNNEPFADLICHVLERQCAATVLVTPPPFDRSERNIIDFARNNKRQAYESLVSEAGLELAAVRALGPDLAIQRFDAGFAYVVEIPSYETAIGEHVFDAVADNLPPGTAVIFLNDWQAASFLAACDKSGRSAVDRRLRVTAYEDTEVAQWLGISTVDPQLGEIGRLAYKRLQEALEDRAFAYSTDSVRGIVRLRRSTEWVT